MKAVGRYDSALQMFVEEPREPDLRRLTFLRWLIERNRLEHGISGPVSGELAPKTSDGFDPDPENDGPYLPLASARARAEGSVLAIRGRFPDGQTSAGPMMEAPRGGGLERFKR